MLIVAMKLDNIRCYDRPKADTICGPFCNMMPF